MYDAYASIHMIYGRLTIEISSLPFNDIILRACIFISPNFILSPLFKNGLCYSIAQPVGLVFIVP